MLDRAAGHRTDRLFKVRRKQARGQSRDKGLLAIAIFKWIKGLILILVGVGCLKLLHRNLADVLQTFVNELRVDPDNRYLGALLAN
jgi:hypothetical protein